MGMTFRSGAFRKPNHRGRFIIAATMGMVFGYFIGICFPLVSLSEINWPSSLVKNLNVPFIYRHRHKSRHIPEMRVSTDPEPPKIYVTTNPPGAESLPPEIIVSESDFYLRRLWGEPSEDLKKKPKYLVTFIVGLDQMNNIDASVKKFSEDFQIMLFHYDGWTSEWDQFEWSKKAVHVSVRKQGKWWYAKRFLHPDIVAVYDYIFIWDEDLGVEHFNGDKYMKLVKKYGLEISQPGIEPNDRLQWQLTERRGDREVHKSTEEKSSWCSSPNSPPCAAFVEIMAPVFSRKAWRCVWHMIQNDLVHGWGLDFALRRCVEHPHEKIGVVDSQWLIHQLIPSLAKQVKPEKDKAPWQVVRRRERNEWAEFQERLANADKAYFAHIA
ncbi:uncharacterized protein LOC127798362 isoform X2 [Diospyros lotus]|uniref:uncharacterized protein LOC127798362 isoform X2 n=1 Tax=Diospyros lotus TaxID=55363 RepID=UPI002250B29F|nr:uncharacterized protein LOC127798362 isoform X2 [Diospyros lotus]